MHIEAGQWISVQSFFHCINNCVGLGHGGWRPTKNKNASQRATNEKKRSAHAHSHAIRFRRNWIVEKLRKFICAKTSKEDGGERGEARERRNCSYIISSSHMKCWKLVQWPAHTEKLRCRNITKRSGLSEVSYTKQHTKKNCFICENRKLWFGLLVIDDTTNKRRRRHHPHHPSLWSLAAFSQLWVRQSILIFRSTAFKAKDLIPWRSGCGRHKKKIGQFKGTFTELHDENNYFCWV